MGGVGVLHAYVCVHVRSTAAYDVCSVCYEAEVSWEAPTMRIIAKPKLTISSDTDSAAVYLGINVKLQS